MPSAALLPSWPPEPEPVPCCPGTQTETLEGQPPAQLTFLPLPAEVCSCPSS